jgi:competence protein ComFC
MRAGLLGRAGKAALDFLLPLYCVECRREGRGVCQECLAGMTELRAYCEVCAQPGSARRCRRCVVTPLPIRGIRAVYPFEGVIRSAVHALKYRNYRALAPELAAILARRLDDADIPATLLVPVPMHPRRERSRGYNQAELLASELGRLTGVPMAKDVLERLVDSPPQVQRGTRAGRMEIAEGTFSVAASVEGEAILLIDDVVTTGSTMAACAKVLWEASAVSVWGLALAREA